MPDQSIRVLIVEDQHLVADVIERSLSQIRASFPGLKFERVETLSEALAIVMTDPPPDLVTLDLRLKDSSPIETMASVRTIEARCPVVLVTGRMVEGFEDMLRELNIEVIAKGQSWLADNRFVDAAARAIVRGSERIGLIRDDEKMKARVRKLREILERMYPPEKPPTTHGSRE